MKAGWPELMEMLQNGEIDLMGDVSYTPERAEGMLFSELPEQARASVEIYREYFEDKGMFENAVYPGIPELLDGLKKDGYKLYVATSKPEQYSVKIIEHFGLAEYFKMVGGADMNETRVHKGDVIRYVMESCGFTDSSEIVMVGDRENDMNGAKQNHMESVGVLYGYGSREELENSGAGHIAKTVEELGKVLRSL